MSGGRRSDNRELATEVWRLIADFTFTRFQRGEHMAVLRAMGLTPGHLKALYEPPKELLALDTERLEVLRGALAHLPVAEGGMGAHLKGQARPDAEPAAEASAAPA